jgi:hypothetical protein
MAIMLIRIFTGDPKGERAQTDTSGGGHRWRLVDDQPWCRVYVAVSGT